MARTPVRDWMHVGVVTCRPDTAAAEVADTMKAHDVSALVVVDDGGYVVGVISRTDLLNAVFVQPYLQHWRGMTAQHLMSSPVVSVRSDTSVEEAIALIHDRRIHRIVVTARDGDRERPIGILSVTDVASHIAEA